MSGATEDNAVRDDNARLIAQNATLALNMNRMRRELDVWVKAAGATGDPNVDGDTEREIALLKQLLETERKEHEDELTALRTYAAEVEFALLSALSSSSWRLTAPMRNAIRRLRGHPPPAPFSPRYLGSE